jgi:hypothetical protein
MHIPGRSALNQAVLFPSNRPGACRTADTTLGCAILKRSRARCGKSHQIGTENALVLTGWPPFSRLIPGKQSPSNDVCRIAQIVAKLTASCRTES